MPHQTIALGLSLLLLAPCLRAQTAEAAAPPAAAAAVAATADDPPAAEARREWDAALGLTTAYRPRYAGAPRSTLHATPGVYLRWGRYTLTNASGFAPRRSEDVAQGLGVELVQNEHLRMSTSLRLDSGRSEHSSAAYAGLGNIHSTVRGRVAASWDFNGPWRAGASWNVDMLGRGNGGVGDVSVGWDRRLTPEYQLTLGASLSLADRRYMQNYYGITPQQSAHSEYAEYRASGGVRDVGANANLRHDFSRDWVMLGTVGFSRLMGSAAASPITRSRNGSSISGGVARQF